MLASAENDVDVGTEIVPEDLDDLDDLDDDLRSMARGDDEAGCFDPSACIVPDPFHSRSECCTAEDCEAYERELIVQERLREIDSSGRVGGFSIPITMYPHTIVYAPGKEFPDEGESS